MNKIGLLFFASVVSFISAMNPVILTFPAERGVFLKEENAKLYRVSSYFVGRTVVEIPFMIIIPIVWSLIVYWLVELNSDTAETVIKFFFIMILQSMAGNSLGLLGGSAFSDAKVAMGFAPVLMLPFMVFAGFYANRANLVAWIGWIEYISPFKYAFEALCWNEFEGSKFKPNPTEMLGLDLSYWKCVGVLIGLFFGYRALAFILLASLKKRLQ